LHQHLPDVVDGSVEHRQQAPGERPTHWISLQPDSALATTLGRTRAKVNSFHHQAIDRLGDGLQATAWAADGTIEGIEDQAGSYVLGVQWHAEALARRPEQAGLFGSFITACRLYERSERSLGRAA
jgi:putative glutamine amidotransferase